MKVKLKSPYADIPEGEVLEVVSNYFISAVDKRGITYTINKDFLIGFDPAAENTDKIVKSLISVTQEMKTLNIEFK